MDVPASAEDASARAAYRDVEQTLGLVPGFFRMFPEPGIAGAWTSFKAVQLSPDTVLRLAAERARTAPTR